jgi:hypothetical protein
MTGGWLDVVKADPRPWLLDESDPAVRAATLVRLMGCPAESPEVVEARRRAMVTDPIQGILDAQDPEGWWVKPGPGYGPKYCGTVWNLIFLGQLGADPSDDRIRRASEYVMRWSATAAGGYGASGVAKERPPPPSSAIHCLNGNLIHALVGFGYLDDPRVAAAVEWAAGTILGEGVERWYASGTSGPGFACAANDGEPCAWGAVKELRGLAAIPEDRRSPLVRRALDAGAAFLLSRDPLDADYPMGWGNTKPSRTWFRPGFPLGYTSDVLEVLEVLAALGYAADPRLERAVTWLVGLQDSRGRWSNRNAYRGKTTVEIERPGEPSRWVTLRACTVLAAVFG